jgi:hypothetical protein
MGILFSKQPESDAKLQEQVVTESKVQQITEKTQLETVVAETILTEPTVPEATNVIPVEAISEVNSIVPEATSVVTENLDPTTSGLFERAVEQTNKVEVVPVSVNPGADVVKKTNKKKNKKSKSV